jgi:hypothetical protein
VPEGLLSRSDGLLVGVVDYGGVVELAHRAGGTEDRLGVDGHLGGVDGGDAAVLPGGHGDRSEKA